MKNILKSSLVSFCTVSAVWLSSGYFQVSPEVFVPWLQLAGFSAMAANHSLQMAKQFEAKDKPKV
ncbi:MAG: hypothetical protein F6J86_44420 [Symploca sp. SIO1B1]|nr:hypothetical protein [Symploca sp. SIO1B1]